MKIFYFILFAAVGITCIAAAVIDWKPFIGYWVNRNTRSAKPRKSRRSVRLRIGVVGVLLVLFGFAVLFGWLI